MGATTQIPLAEYLATSYEPDREYVDGELVERSMGTYRHGRLQWKLIAAFERIQGNRRLFGCAELRLKLGPSHYRIPDLCVFADQEPQAPVPDVPPEIAIETVSPDDRHVDILTKLGEYRTFGVRNIWLINPENKQLSVFDSNGLREVPSLTLPEYGFEVKSADLF